MLLAPDQIASKVAKFQSMQISLKYSINTSQIMLIATNSTDYNTIARSLSKLMNCKAFLSYCRTIKYQLELDNGIMEFSLKYHYLLLDNMQ